MPLDHDDPSGSRILIALVRVPSPTADKSLFVNPGGPGASGISFLRNGFRLDDESMARFHLVAFDPRGVGASSPLRCSLPRAGQLVSGQLPDLSPTTGSGSNTDGLGDETLDRWARAEAASCAADGERLDHQSTETVARDLDLLRAAVGDETLDYLGFSYGSALGLTYRRLHPDRTGRLVLDGIVDPVAGIRGLLTQQALGFDRAFQQLVDRCAGVATPIAPTSPTDAPACPDEPVERLYDRLERTQAERQSRSERGNPATVSPSTLELATLLALYDDSLWTRYLQALVAADQGDWSDLQALASSLFGPVETAAYLSTICTDPGAPVGPEGWDSLAGEMSGLSTRFGATIVNEVRACAFWPASPEPEPLDSGPPSDVQASSVLLIGATGDAATPIESARAVHDRLPGSTLVVVDDWAHTSYNASACVRAAVADHLGTESMGATLVNCSADS